MPLDEWRTSILSKVRSGSDKEWHIRSSYYETSLHGSIHERMTVANGHGKERRAIMSPGKTCRQAGGNMLEVLDGRHVGMGVGGAVDVCMHACASD